MIATATPPRAFNHALEVVASVGFWNISAPATIKDLEGMALDLYAKLKDEPPGFQRAVCEKFSSLLITMEYCTKWHHDRIFRDLLPFLDISEQVKVWTLKEVYESPVPKWRARPFARVGTNAILYGQPGSQKSFWALDYAMNVALGRKWCGFPTLKGRVLYVYAEGNVGMQKLRQRAWNLANGFEPEAEHDDQIRFVLCPVNMADPNHVQLDALLEDIKDFDPALVIFDTFNRSLNGGNENLADMIALFSNNLGILNRLGCDTLTIHHPNKNKEAEEMRGSSALHGNFDIVANLRKNGQELKVRFEKVKDGDDTVEMIFRSEVVRLGIFEDMGEGCEPEEYTSCAIVHSRVVKKRDTNVNGIVMLSPNQWALLRALTETLPQGKWLERVGRKAGASTQNDIEKLVALELVSTPGKRQPYSLTPKGESACRQPREV